MAFEITAIGRVESARRDVADTDNWGAVVSGIALDERFGDRALTGLADFSHVEVLFLFDQLDERPDYRVPRPSRGRDDLPAVGVFCDRGPRRPNRIGATICEIVRIEPARLTVRGLDAVDGTPVIDIKPVMLEFLPAEVRQPAWVSALMSEYFKS